ncbi:MAG: hypothetical protein ACLQPD_24840 [Desulfomonilaceae bacterium]
MAHLRHLIVGPLPISMKAKDEKKNEVVVMTVGDDLNRKEREERGERGTTSAGVVADFTTKVV